MCHVGDCVRQTQFVLLCWQTVAAMLIHFCVFLWVGETATMQQVLPGFKSGYDPAELTEFVPVWRMHFVKFLLVAF